MVPYVEISPNADGGIPSETLGLDFHLLMDDLGIYDPSAAEWLQTPAAAEARAERAEAEIERLQEELARLKENS